MIMKIVFFRLDSGLYHGTGHLYRCLNLAAQLDNCEIHFICKDFPHNLVNKITDNDYHLHLISGNWKIDSNVKTWLGENFSEDANKCQLILNKYSVNLLIIDHYGIDYKWCQLMSSSTKKLMVIDDYPLTVNRKHYCHFYLNCQLKQIDEQYLLNYQCQTFLGHQYLLINPQFYYLNKTKKINPEIKTILIFFGGSDLNNLTAQTIKLCQNISHIQFKVLTGGSNPHANKIKEQCHKLSNFEYYHYLSDMPQFLIDIDFCIGSIGTSTYERCIMRIPSLCLATADNQLTVIKSLQSLKVIDVITDLNHLQSKLNHYLVNPNQYLHLVNNCQKYFQNNTIRKLIENLI